MENSIETPRFKLQLHPDGYYILTIGDDISEITIDDVKKMVEAGKELGAQRLPTLVMGAYNTILTTETMNYISKNENFPYSMAGAYVVSSASQRLLSNFYLKLKNPQRPTKFFNSTQEAIKWIMEIKNKN